MEYTNPRTLTDLKEVEYLLNVNPNEKPQNVAESWFKDVYGYTGDGLICNHLFTEKTVRVFMATVKGEVFPPVYLKWNTLL